jgi:hypothetical protein
VGILAAHHHFEQSLILINKLQTAADDERNVCIAELSETIGAFLQRIDSIFLLGEHLVGVTLR